MLGRTVLFTERLNPFHHQVGFWQNTKIFRQLLINVRQIFARVFQIHFRAFVVVRIEEALVGADIIKEVLQIAIKFNFLFNRDHLIGQAFDFTQAYLMNFISG